MYIYIYTGIFPAAIVLTGLDCVREARAVAQPDRL